MKILINESQFYNLIPSSVKRRLEVDDLEILDKTINMKIRGRGNWFHSDTFEQYFDDIILGSIEYLVYNHKEWGMDTDDWLKRRTEMEKIFQGLIPYLEKRYRNQAKAYYKKMKS